MPSDAVLAREIDAVIRSKQMDPATKLFTIQEMIAPVVQRAAAEDAAPKTGKGPKAAKGDA